MAFEKYIFPNMDEPGMGIHLLRAIVGEYIEEHLTKQECVDVIEEHLTYNNGGVAVVLTADEKSDLQAWMIAIDAANKLEEKRNVADDAYRVLIIAEASPGVTLYDTPAKLKARLSWI